MSPSQVRRQAVDFITPQTSDNQTAEKQLIVSCRREKRKVPNVRYREIILPDYPKHLVTIKFIIGTPPLPAKPLSSEGVERSKLMGKVNQEMTEHGDMVMLPVSHTGHPGGEVGGMTSSVCLSCPS